MSPRVEIELSGSVVQALRERADRTGESLGRIVDGLLSESLDLERHSLFQVSTSNALVKGVFDGATTVAELLAHGDFGLGTFDRLDGELILIDGECFRATAEGAVSDADDDREVPFALVTRFEPDVEETVEAEVSLPELTVAIDALRPTQNLFAAIRIDGRFDALSLRAACPARPGESLIEATAHQSEFDLNDVAGTLVGFWAPEYARAVSVPGYHFHFISENRQRGGHVLGMQARNLAIGVHLERDLHLSLPETADFLTADLRGEHAEALEKAETGHSD